MLLGHALSHPFLLFQVQEACAKGMAGFKNEFSDNDYSGQLKTSSTDTAFYTIPENFGIDYTSVNQIL